MTVRRRPGLFLALAGMSGLLAVVAITGPPRADGGPATLRITPAQASVITAMVSVFQNDTALTQYDFVEERFDGAGLVAGRDAFSSARGDLLQVVQAFTADHSDSPLARYLPALTRLAAANSDDVSELVDLDVAWRQAADDPAFRTAQDRVDEQRYFAPAQQRAQELGLRTPLGLAIMYDTAVQHGFGPGPDGLGALIDAATAGVRGDPANGVPERAWLDALLDARAADLRNPADGRRQETWSASEGRAFALRRLLGAGNYALSTPVNVNPYGTPHVLFPFSAAGGGPAVGATGGLTISPTADPSATPTASPSGSPAAGPPSTVAGPPKEIAVSTTEGLRAALAAAGPGQTIAMADGLYAGNFTVSTSGTASQPITLKGSASAVLTSTSYGLHVQGSYWRLTGFTVTRSLKGIVLDGANHNVIDSVTVHDIQQEGVHLRRNSSDNVLRGLKVYNIPQSGVIIGQNAGGWTNGVPDRSERNTVTASTFGPGITSRHIQIYEGSTGDALTDNTFNGAGITQGGTWVDIRGNNVGVAGNTGTAAPEDGFQTHTVDGGWGCGMDFHNNYLDVRASGYGFRIDNRTGCANTVRANNTVLNAGSGIANIAVTP